MVRPFRIRSGLTRMINSSFDSPTKATLPRLRVASMHNRCDCSFPEQSRAHDTPFRHGSKSREKVGMAPLQINVPKVFR